MKIAIGSDHAGLALKEQLRNRLTQAGHEVADFGANSPDSSDYPDYAGPVAREVASGKADRGILVCYTGVGMSITANKVRGIRAALAVSVEEVRLTRLHNDANVLTLGALYTSFESAADMVDTFLSTEFEGGRHARRVGKITSIEEGNAQ
ncbi:MAG: ribose 5-phosphate isomerase B [Candidatus Solibacter sp.]|nr:ribose 5-phosphate isomerase B [Candidatus Solibacter sp.]